MEGCVEGKNAWARTRMECIQHIIDNQGCVSSGKTKRKASNKEEW